jgi:hypothetical protein
MEFRQTSQNGVHTNASPNPANPVPVTPKPKSPSMDNGSVDRASKWLRIMNFVVLVGIAVLVGGIAFAFTRGGQANESKFIAKTNYQAVFLNNNQVNSQVQVYFGKITSLNSQYIVLQDVYYLTQASATGTTNTSTASGNLTLVKLGCQQIHDPLDQMILSRSQVTFWENLNTNGQVVKKISEFKKSYPNGPDCTQASQGQATSPTGTTSTGTTTPTAPAATTPAKP